MAMRAAVLLLVLCATFALADDVLQVGSVNVDPPTLVTLGVQLLVSGDDDRDASVAVRYRAVGESTWRDALPLFRVRPEVVVGRTVPEQFAGSIFELTPDTAYEIELHATDTDGPVDIVVPVTASTRPLPSGPANPVVRNVSTASALQSALSSAAPGDVITLADGVYAGDFTMTASGTVADPIVIRGTSIAGTIVDAGCNDCNVLEVYGSHVHVERLTLRNANRGLRFQGASAIGNVVRRVRIEDVRLGIGSQADQRDFYLCDNELQGRLAWPLVYADDGGAHSDDDGILVNGSGHVVCHNWLAGFGDALKIANEGARAIDFYGNEVMSAYDNGLELDNSEGNTRAFRNRFTNTYATLSFQPIYGGPAYALRNVVVNVAHEQLKFHGLGGSPAREPSGMIVLHNTFVSPALALNLQTGATSHFFTLANNIFVGPSPAGARVVDWSSPINGGTLDYDGWFPDGRFDFDAAGNHLSFAAMQAAGSLETHGVLLDANTFASGLAAPASFRDTLEAQDVTLASGTPALDAGLVLPNVNDGFDGTGPDLGALEHGCPVPHFGVRPEGIDETNEPTGCGGPPSIPTTTTTTLPWITIRTSGLTLRDDVVPPINPDARRVSFKSSTKRDPAANRIVPPAPGSTGDPILGGATLTVYDSAGSGEKVVVTLPAGAGWSTLGSASSPKGWRFRSDGPVTSVTVKADSIKVKGGKAGWTYTLDEPTQGRVAVRLALGTARPWCADAPGKSDRPGSFVAEKMAAPSLCPAVP
jgi:hypothetical protein